HLEKLMQTGELRLPGDHVDRGRTGCGGGKARLRHPRPLDGRHEPEAPPMHRFHESRVSDLVVEGVTDLADRLGERGLGDRDAAPDGVEEFRLADEYPRALRKVAKNGPGLRPQRDGSVAGA